jgi:phosphatidylglycerol---prolipoprotein diacylglyceryl transferase
MSTLSVIEIGIDPYVRLGPVTLAWHGITVALGVVVGAVLARRVATERGLDAAELLNAVLVATMAGLVGAKLLYLLETGALRDPSQWISVRGFAFNGALLFATLGVAAYLRIRRLSLGYLDAAALGFPLGMAVGRVGDIINGEHYGPPSESLLAIRHTHPAASVPDQALAYHDGGLYESLMSLAIFAAVWPQRRRLRAPLLPLILVVGLYALGRFFLFFLRYDSEVLALGLSTSQWVSLAMLATAVAAAFVGRWMSGRPRPARPESR